jgi:hypothetical protein
MKEKQNREAKLPSKLLTSKQTPQARLGRCPHLQNLTAKLRKTKRKVEKVDLAHVLPIPKLTHGRRPYHFSSYTMSFNIQAKKEKKCTRKLENERGVEEYLPNPPKGS